RGSLPIAESSYVAFDRHARRAGYRDYEDLLAAATDDEPTRGVGHGDPWMFMYTSGTTGRPKGGIRGHLGAAHMALVTEIELGLGRDDMALLVMPMCHANSLWFFSAFAYCGAPTTVYSRKSFDPEHAVQVLAESGASFTSLVPTHFITMLDLPKSVRTR